jgi:hypothetical protein
MVNKPSITESMYLVITTCVKSTFSSEYLCMLFKEAESLDRIYTCNNNSLRFTLKLIRLIIIIDIYIHWILEYFVILFIWRHNLPERNLLVLFTWNTILYSSMKSVIFLHSDQLQESISTYHAVFSTFTKTPYLAWVSITSTIFSFEVWGSSIEIIRWIPTILEYHSSIISFILLATL